MSAALAVAASLVATSSAPVTLDDVVGVALQEAESPRIARARVALAEAAVREAWAAVLPTLGVSGTYRRRAFEVAVTRENEDGTTERNVLQANDAFAGEARLQSTLVDARVIPGIGAAEDARAAAEAALVESRFALAHQVADAYVAVRVAEAALTAARRRLEVAEADARSARARRDAGLLANVDRDRAVLEAVEAEVAVTRGGEAARRARLALGLIVGREIEEGLAPADVELPRGPAALLIEAAIAGRPEVEVARASVLAARDRALVPWLGLVPSLGVDAVANVTNETGFLGRAFNWNVALTLQWILYDGGLRYAEATRASANLEIAELELSRLLRMVRTEVEEALVVLETAQADVSLAARRVEVARRYAEEVRERSTRGLATAVEAADAAVSLYEAEVEAATGESRLAQARLRLRRSVGLFPTSTRR